MAETELAARRSARIDELAGLDELQVGSEASRVGGIEAGDRRRCVLAPADTDRDGDRRGEESPDYEVAQDDPDAAESVLL